LKDEICARISQQLENNNLNVIAVKEFSANDLRAMPPLFMIEERLFVAVLQQSFVRIKDYIKIVARGPALLFISLLSIAVIQDDSWPTGPL
jgi:hypothetical protein